MKSILRALLGLSVTMALCSCAVGVPDKPLSHQYWKDHKHKTVIVEDRSTGATVRQNENAGLLNMVISGCIESDLASYLSKYSSQWYRSFEKQVRLHLNQSHIANGMAKKKLDFDSLVVDERATDEKARRVYSVPDFRPLQKRIGGDRVFTVQVIQLGVEERTRHALWGKNFRAICELRGRLVDLHTNKILWRYSTRREERVLSPWSQKPNYPNVTKALKHVTSEATAELLENFTLHQHDKSSGNKVAKHLSAVSHMLG